MVGTTYSSLCPQRISMIRLTQLFQIGTTGLEMLLGDVTWRCYFKVDRRTDLTIGYIKIMFARQVMLFFIAIAAVIPVNTDSVKLKHLYYRQR